MTTTVLPDPAYFHAKLLTSGIFAAILLTLCAIALPAHAQTLEGEARYSMSATDNGFVRLDKVTGAMTFCKEAEGSLVCKLSADERQALTGEISALEDKIARLERKLNNGYRAEGGDQNLGPVEEKTWEETEAEMDKALSFGEKMIRRFFQLFKDLEAEEKADANKTPA